MRGQRSPYTTLGLRPGADRAAVEEAYRRLIKQHHPDRPGGDADEAAEINRAYASLKGEASPPLLPALLQDRHWFGRHRRQHGRLAGILMLIAAVGALLLLPLPGRKDSVTLERPIEGIVARDRPALPDTFDLRSLPDEDAIATAVAAARRLHRERLTAEAIEFSRGCEDDLKTYPNPSLLDHCVAFDAAMGLLAGDSAPGWFRAEDMAARHMGAALRVSDDPVLAEERIGVVRRKAEQVLTSQEP